MIPFSGWAITIFVLSLTWQSPASATKNVAENVSPIHPLIIQIHAHTPDEVAGVLRRAQSWSESFATYPERPIALVLHGDEAQVFVKKNYGQYREIVDLAAQLDAFNVVDIQICETWMNFNGVNKNEMPPFIDTVPYGPAEEKRLIEAGYQSF